MYREQINRNTDLNLLIALRVTAYKIYFTTRQQKKELQLKCSFSFYHRHIINKNSRPFYDTK